MQKKNFKILKNLKSPDAIFQTSHGTLYNLSFENQKLFKLNALQLNIGEFYSIEEEMEKMKNLSISLKNYLRFKESTLLCLSLINSQSEESNLEGCKIKGNLKIRISKGIQEISFDRLLVIANLMNPDIFIPLAELPPKKTSGKKSNERSIAKTNLFLDKSLSNFKEVNKIQTLIFGPVIGGIYKELQKKSIEEICKRSVDGFVIYGLCQGESFKERAEILMNINETILREKKENLPIILHSNGEFIDILHGIYHGIDFFNSDWPFQMAQKGLAFNLNINSFLEKKNFDNNFIEEKLEDEIFEGKNILKLNIYDQKFEKDDARLVESCECYTCKTNFSRSYINHLLKCHEMTANVLLTIHNLFVYEYFFQICKESIEKNYFKRFLFWILNENCS